MLEVKNPYKKEALIKALESSYSQVKSYFISLSVENFFRKSQDKWSPSENLVHLTKSVRAVSVRVRLPKIIIWLKFGKSERNSRIYPQIRQVYLDRLVEGAKSHPKFEPDDQQQTSDLAADRKQILKKWDEVHQKLIRNLRRWKEEDLDKYILPYPILGILTVREVIMITIYHNIHHLTNVQRSNAASQD